MNASLSAITASIAVAAAWCVSFMGVILILAYRRSSLGVASIVLSVLLLVYWAFGTAPDWWHVILSIPVGMMLLLNVAPQRIGLLTRPFLKKYRRLLPSMSATEREALDAGTCGGTENCSPAVRIGRS